MSLIVGFVLVADHLCLNTSKGNVVLEDAAYRPVLPGLTTQDHCNSLGGNDWKALMGEKDMMVRGIGLGRFGQVPVPDSSQTKNKRVHAPFVVVGILFFEVLTGGCCPPQKFALSENWQFHYFYLSIIRYRHKVVRGLVFYTY